MNNDKTEYITLKNLENSKKLKNDFFEFYFF